MKAFSFGEEELTANKQGRITARQKKTLNQHIKVSRFSSGLAMIATIVSIAVMLGMVIFTSQGPGLKQAAPYLAGTAFLVFVFTGAFTFLGLRKLRVLQREEISVREGALRLNSKNLGYGSMQAHYVWIDEFRFQLTSEKQLKTLVNGGQYRVYYVHYPPTHIILSVEEAS